MLGAWAAAACSIAAAAVSVAGLKGAPRSDSTAGTAPPSAEPPLPAVLVDRDNITIDRSCTLVLPPLALDDSDGNGIVHITAPGITVDLAGGTLRGATDRMAPESIRGIGIRISAPGVTVRNGIVLGFRVGVMADGAARTTVEGLDIGYGFRQRLESDPWAEDSRDWLWPHENDAGEWSQRYGAAVCLRSAPGSTVRDVRVRHQQNGILLERSDGSRVHDCDASFLSGWGIALWRTSDSVIARNATDFCVRGYSHGRYNRGQDSAGILLFEQCSRNTIALNSATHCGDGIFIFAGREALGERAGAAQHAGLGCNDNTIALNDLSDAVAHGVEATFSFRNRVLRNRIDRAAICGVWGGYSRELTVAGNLMRACGFPGAGSERGGLNVEHGSGTCIESNTFEGCAVGVRLWTDDDPHLSRLPWTQANPPSAPSRIVGNDFSGDGYGIELRDCGPVEIAGNSFSPAMRDSGRAEVADAASAARIARGGAAGNGGADRASGGAEGRAGPASQWSETAVRTAIGELPGRMEAVRIVDGIPRSARDALAGRESILMLDYGPWDFESPQLYRDPNSTGPHRWRLLGPAKIQRALVRGSANFRTAGSLEENYAEVFSEDEGCIANYELGVAWGDAPHERRVVKETFFGANWSVQVFPLEGDPIADRDAFERSLRAPGSQTTVTDTLRLPFGAGGPSELKLVGPGFPTDRFGLRATTTLTVFPGCWNFTCVSDDAVCVSVDGKPLIEDWTRHGAQAREARISVDAPTVMRMQVDFVELDGAATLELMVAPCAPDGGLTPPPAAPIMR
jgi:nitrous oxidase accessory protein NosD